jgi:hypothetical protein
VWQVQRWPLGTRSSVDHAGQIWSRIPVLAGGAVRQCDRLKIWLRFLAGRFLGQRGLAGALQ